MAFGRTFLHRAVPISLPLLLALSSWAGTFTKNVDYVSGPGGVSGVAAGDFNGDGKLDLAVSNDDPQHGTVSVLLGSGDGTFQSPLSYPVGTYPQAVVTADFNSDGVLDLAVANGGSLSISILFGNGNGTFGTAVNYALGQPFKIASADVNGDGAPDLLSITGTNMSGDLQVLLNNGDGTFQSPVSYPVQDLPNGLTVGDFNRDQKPDVAVANDYSGTVSVLLGKGDGTFQGATNYVIGSNVFDLAIASSDLNGDGNLDLLTVDAGINEVSVLLGNGDGTFAPPVNYPTGNEPDAIVAGDFTRDGRIDVATSNYMTFSGTVSILIGNGDGSLQAPMSRTAGPAPESIISADLNADQELDLVTGNLDNGGSVSVLLNTGGTVLNTTSSLNPSQVGQPVTFTTTVSATVGMGRTPTGTITFKDGTVVLGSAPLMLGHASLTVSSLTQGQHTINAHYTGSLSFNADDAPPLTQVVNP